MQCMTSNYRNKHRVGVYKQEVTQLEVWRHTTGLTRPALAALLGVHHTTVRRWCFGTSLPTFPAAVRIHDITSGAVPLVTWKGLSLWKTAMDAMERTSREATAEMGLR